MIFINNYKIYLKKGSCSRCHSNNSIVIHRKYSGERLCQNCFEKSIEKNVYNSISKFKMLKPQNKIIVGLSGGKDSISLLYFLIRIQERTYNSKPLIALTIDEGIKDYRDKSIEVAKNFCRNHNIEHKIISFKEIVGKTLDDIVNLKKNSEGYKYACNYCATLRRRILNEGAKDLGGDVLAMGHNLTDLSETFLMNILSKRFKLISNQYFFKKESEEIKKFFIKKIIPLLKIPEEEIFLFANIRKLNYYPSHCPYRDKDPILRKRVLGFVQECKKYSPEIEFNLFNGFLELSNILYHHYEKINHNYCQNCGYPCGNTKICTYCRLIKSFIS
ncbi:MAG: ATP-binding protein [Promethearchaeota archaeon]